MNGVPLVDIVRHHRTAIRDTRAYQKDTAELYQLENQLATGYVQGKTAEIERQIKILKDHIARNPVKPLMDGGLMPTIVEDVAAEEDIYSFKSRFTRKVEGFTNKLNPTVVDIGRTLYMTHDTKLYRGLSYVTQLSDFVARYTLYQHLVSKKNPLSSADAIQEASDSFVNYDIPMHQTVQYLDDMGIMMFTKYFLRIQRVLLKLAREHPTRVIGMMLLDDYFNIAPLVTESSVLNHLFNNPFQAGALNYPAVIDETLLLNAGLSLLK
jgi:hypothetical protein